LAFSKAATNFLFKGELCEAEYYSNEAKTEMLGVSDDILATLGAVSEATAWAMAAGALKRSNADVAIAISGIAGPGGGSEKKPVGTVVFARALKDESAGPVLADTHHFGDLGRAEIRRQAALRMVSGALLRMVVGPEPDIVFKSGDPAFNAAARD
jgi:nicotinamide-nucleotide amidase